MLLSPVFPRIWILLPFCTPPPPHITNMAVGGGLRLGRTLNVPHPTPLCTIHGCCVGILCPGLNPTQGLQWLSGDPGNLLWKQPPVVPALWG